jgi:hypothetical protein
VREEATAITVGARNRARLSAVWRHDFLARFNFAMLVHAVVNYSSYLLALRFMVPNKAFGVALVVGLVLQPIANFKFVFATAFTPSRLLGYLAYISAYFCVNLVLLNVSIDWLGIPAVIAPAIIVLALLPFNFMLTRRIILQRN